MNQARGVLREGISWSPSADAFVELVEVDEDLVEAASEPEIDELPRSAAKHHCFQSHCKSFSCLKERRLHTISFSLNIKLFFSQRRSTAFAGAQMQVVLVPIRLEMLSLIRYALEGRHFTQAAA